MWAAVTARPRTMKAASFCLTRFWGLLYQLHFKPASRRMFTLRENMLFYEKWTRSFELETVLYYYYNFRA
jgi:hypothetical protein